MRAAVLRRVRPVADSQLGVITSGQLRALGVDGEVPRREGWLHLAAGIWLVSTDPTDEQLLVGLQHYAPAALASGALACRWLGLRYPPKGPGCDALVAHGTNLLGGPLLRTRQTRRLPDATEHRGRRIVPADRAVADAARWTPRLRDARAVVLAALHDERVPPQALADELAAGPRRTARHLRQALQDWDRGARSAPEAEAADALLALNGRRPAPAFLLNPDLHLDGVLLGSPDGWVPAAGLGWEMDSVEFHGDSDALDATLRRHQAFTDAGLELLHVTPKRFREAPQAWAADIAARAEARVAQGWRPSRGLVVTPVGPVVSSRTAAA